MFLDIQKISAQKDTGLMNIMNPGYNAKLHKYMKIGMSHRVKRGELKRIKDDIVISS